MAKIIGRLITYSDKPDALGDVYKPGSVDLSGLDETVTLNFDPRLPVGKITYITDGPEGVDVEVEVDQRYELVLCPPVASEVPSARIRRDSGGYSLQSVSLIPKKTAV